MEGTLFQRMIHGRINLIIDPQLPYEQAGFCKRRSTVDQVTLLTHDIEDCFEAKETAGAVLVDLTAAYNIMWHRRLTLKLLRMLTDRHMVHFIVEMISNCSYVLKTSDGHQSRLSRLKNGFIYTPAFWRPPRICFRSPILYHILISYS